MFFYKIIITLFGSLMIYNLIFVKSYNIINFSQNKKSFEFNYNINNKLEIPYYKYKILKTSILNFMPFIKLHHLVVIENNNTNANKIYTIDFSPINQTSHKTLIKLFFSKNIQSEIRIRSIENTTFDNNKEIITLWNNLNNLTYIESQKLSNNILDEIDDINLKNKIIKIKDYDKYMNLYNHNCQHFAKYVIKNLESNNN